MFYFHRRLIKPGLFILIGLLQACGSGISKTSLNLSTGDINFETPVSLNQHIFDTTLILAELKVDDGNSVPMIVDQKSGMVSGRIFDIKNGVHQLELHYYVFDKTENITIAIEKFSLEVVKKKTASLESTGFYYTDEDNDGISNIAEINFNTNLYDPKDKPKSHGVHGSASYVVLDDTLDDIKIEKSSSDNYSIEQQ